MSDQTTIGRYGEECPHCRKTLVPRDIAMKICGICNFSINPMQTKKASEDALFANPNNFRNYIPQWEKDFAIQFTGKITDSNYLEITQFISDLLKEKDEANLH